MDTDRDPDVDDDPDIKRDKDLSLNYKTIGGSIASRVLGRYLECDPLALRVATRFVQTDLDRTGLNDEYVRVVRKDTGETTHVKKDTLKGPEGAKYKVVRDEKEEGGEKGGPSKEDVDEVLEMAERNPKLKGMLDILSDPKHKEHTTLTSLPNMPVNVMIKDVELPEGIHTIGDLQAVVQQAKAKGSKAPRKGPKNLSPKEGPKPKGPPGKGPSTSFPQGMKTPFYFDEDYSYGGPSREEKEALKSWIEEGGHEKPDFKEWADKQKTVSEEDGKLLFPSKGKKVPFENLPSSAQAKLKRQFEKHVKTQRNVDALRELAKDPRTKKILRDLANTESPLRQKIEDEAREERRDLEESDIRKTIPQLAHMKLPDGFSSAQDVIDAAEKGFGLPPEPKRPRANRQEVARSEAALSETFPEDVRERLSEMDLHPHDVSDLISHYRAAMKVKVPDEDISEIAKGLHTFDIHELEPPEQITFNGKKVPFKDLSPEDQSEAFAQYKMRSLAASLASEQRITDSLSKAGLSKGPARLISETLIKSGDKDLDDDKVQKFFSKSLASAMASQPLKEEEVQEILKKVGDNPAAKKLVAAYVQASSYVEARLKFLSGDVSYEDSQITEFDSPSEIARKMQKASEFIKEKTKGLPPEACVVDPAMEFRNRVLDRVTYLDEAKVPFVRGYLQDYEMEEYEEKIKDFKKRESEYSKALKKERTTREKELSKGEEGIYRSPSVPEEGTKEDEKDLESRLSRKGIHRPNKPVQPPAYGHWKHKRKVEDSAKESFNWLKELFGFLKGERTKQASLTMAERVVLRTALPDPNQRRAFLAEIGLTQNPYSSYPPQWMMAASSPKIHTALYWGQKPYEGTAPYQGWSQLQARDFSDQDSTNILKAAREWLKLPVLGREIKGLYPDTQFRAALDLAIRDHENGKYSVGLHPTVYNELLAKLSKQSDPYELVTGKPDSVPTKTAGYGYGVTKSIYTNTTTERSTMSASARIRVFASQVAPQNPELAFDMVNLADEIQKEETVENPEAKQAAIRLAAKTQNKFEALRSLTIRQAAQNPQARSAFLPLLQFLKS
jgi:hypothetical protein